MARRSAASFSRTAHIADRALASRQLTRSHHGDDRRSNALLDKLNASRQLIGNVTDDQANLLALRGIQLNQFRNSQNPLNEFTEKSADTHCDFPQAPYKPGNCSGVYLTVQICGIVATHGQCS